MDQSSWRNVKVGFAVGVSDLMFVYPLAVLACRREAGQTLIEALKAKRYWSGWHTQLTLIPYSIAVEAGTKYVDETLPSSISKVPMVAPCFMSCLIAALLQPFEKHLVMEQLLQNGVPAKNKSPSKVHQLLQPLFSIIQYRRENGIRLLYKGYSPLASREFIYISAISVVNPRAVHLCANKDIPGWMGAFAVGFSAGMISAPLQTLNAIMKDERNKSRDLKEIFRSDVLSKGIKNGIHRLFYGAATRSVRCGGAGILYHFWRDKTAPMSVS